MLKEFKAFAMRGNVIDMAVGIVIGGAFGKIVSSFVKDIVMPPIGMLTGGMDFGNVRQHGSGFHHHRLRDLHRHPPDEQAQEAAAASGSDDQGLSGVPDDRADQSQPLRSLHGADPRRSLSKAYSEPGP
jgi:hypothetical protein